MKVKTAYILSVNDPLEHNFTLYNKAIFVGETISVVESNPKWNASVYDVAVQKISVSDLITAFLKQPDVILFYLEVNQVKIGYRIAEFAKKICPETRILVYGLATTFIPQYFLRSPFDAVHISGDREAAITDYLRFIDGELTADQLAGVSMVAANGQIIQGKPGRWLKPKDWPVPSVAKLPVQDYLNFQKGRKSVVDCGLELAITATKGCVTKCNFCGCSEEEGLLDRTRQPETVIAWAEEYGGGKEDTIHLYSPNILSKPSWVEKFSLTYREYGATFKWQGVTRTNTITPATLPLAAQAGCVKLSIGIEHIDSRREKPLKSSIRQLEIAAALCNEYHVDLVGLLMLGHPGQTIDDVRYIIRLLHRLNITNYRFTGYTPLHNLRAMSVEELDGEMLEAYDRRTYYMQGRCAIPAADFYNILITNGKCLGAV